MPDLLHMPAVWFFGLLFAIVPSSSPAVPLGSGEALLLGTVQGLTEFFPVSSSIHLRLAETLLAKRRGGEISVESADCFRRKFSVAIQLASLLPVPFIFYRRVWELLKGLTGHSREGLHLFCCLFLATLPCIPLGLLVDHFGLQDALGWTFSGGALLAGGVYLLAVEKTNFPTKNLKSMRFPQALSIGLLQCVAFFPGISRSLMVLTGCLLCGLSAMAAVEFTFLLGGITLFAATVHTFAVAKFFPGEPLFGAPLATGCLAASFCGWLGLSLLISWLRHGSLRPFAWYRIVLGLSLLLTTIRFGS